MEHTALNGTTTATNHDWKEKKGYTSLVVFVALFLGLAFYAGQIRGTSLAVAGGTIRGATASLTMSHKDYPGVSTFECPIGEEISCLTVASWGTTPRCWCTISWGWRYNIATITNTRWITRITPRNTVHRDDAGWSQSWWRSIMLIMLQYSKLLLLLPLRLLGIWMTEVVRTCSAFLFNASSSILDYLSAIHSIHYVVENKLNTVIVQLIYGKNDDNILFFLL